MVLQPASNMAAITALIFATIGFIQSVSAAGPESLSSRQPALKPCPESPNCVSSLSPEGKHHIDPFQYDQSKEIVYDALVDILSDAKRVQIVVRKPDYIHAEFASRLFGFVDDVEFWFSPQDRLIHVRSASRTGYYDFGVNRRRIERLRRSMATVLE